MSILLLFLMLVALAWACLAMLSGAASAVKLSASLGQPAPKASTPPRHGSIKKAVLLVVFACACVGAVMRVLGHL